MVLDVSEQKALTDLKRKRGVIKASLTRIRTFVTKFDSTQQAVSLLKFRQEELPQINRKFDDIQSQIELLVGEEEDSELERDNFEQDYFAIRSQIQELISLEKPHNSTAVNASFAAMHIHRTQLQPIPLPKFSGNIQEWASFFDIFQAMVHNDENYTAAQKFFYLRSCLEGPALELVRSIPVSDGNYDAIISQLIQRYDNHSLVVQSHIRSIVDCPRVEESRPNTLQRLYSTVSTHLAALRSMGQPVDQWDAWLITIVTSRLDRSTAHGWQLNQRNTRLPKYSDLEIFIASRCTAIETSEACISIGESIGEGQARGSSSKRTTSNSAIKRALVSTNTKSARPCPCCSESHRLFMCEQFKGLSIAERLNMARTSQLCFNCLAPYHTVDTCKSKYTCSKCKQRHHTLLHYEKHITVTSNNRVNDQSGDNTPSTSAQHSSNIAALATAGGGHVFLSTASVLVADNNGQLRKCRVIMDNGSQMNFVSKNFAKLLQLPRHKTMVPVCGIGAGQIHSVSCIYVKVRSRVKQFEVDLVCHVLPVVVDGLPNCPKPTSGWDIPEDLIPQLADPFFDVSGKVDLLIGGGAFFDLFEPKRVRLPTKGVCLQDSRFGWVVTGEICTTSLIATCSIGQACEDNFRILCNDELEPYGAPSKSNKKCIEEQRALKHFKETMSRDETGRFVLRLPLKPEKCKLGSTLEMATARFLSVERRLQRDEELKIQYINFMEEYLRMGHMKRVSQELNQPEYLFYLPHHPIIKLSSVTTKLRVVFDASAKSSSNVSLNDVLMCGPTVQEDLFSILIRFRRYQFVITADIEKMFRQINVASEDQDFQRIVWRSRPDEALQIYRLTTVTYGTTAASFMATNCLISLAEGVRESHPNVSRIIQRDFYMDDLMTGADTAEECYQLQQQIKTILDSAKLPLRKWCSNSRSVLKHIGNSKTDPLFALQINTDDIVNSLGLSWKPEWDEFQFTVENNIIKSKATKRTLLSDLNKIFDPLGFLAPVLVRGKIFLQQLWQLKIDWDKPLDADLIRRWDCFYKGLNDLSCIPIPRKSIPSFSSEVQLHGFCDASEEAFGAAIYVRSKNQMGNWTARLLCSKTRVAPLKGSTIPRLELCGALTLAQLAKKTAEAWDLENSSIYLWTDSMVVIGWLNSEACRLKTYVANRVDQILEITDPKQWRHVKTDENPADALSRGLTPKELQYYEQWWQGPKWLSEESDNWLRASILLPSEESLPEKKPIRLALIAVEPTRDLLNYFSVWHKLVRAAAWLLKFVEFRRSKNAGALSKYLNVADLRRAENGLVKRAQLDRFREELHALKTGKEVSSSSKLKSLYPLLRDDYLILVGGRLNNANITEEQKHPMILPSDHKITRLIFEDMHKTLLHCGPQQLLASVRQRYWPLRGRVMARSVISRCVTCIRARPTFSPPLMAALPKARVQPSRPFIVSGVDFAGPLVVRSGVRRITGVKAWVAVFICFSTRAIHLEAVVGLTSGAFIATLRRFMARRGKCSTIYSDNGTNFVGAQKELTSYIQDCDAQLAREGIEWKFNPPSAPHFGGLWESAVKSTKYHLNRILKDSRLNLEELNTLLCQIEACVNSRPITPLNSDPSELEALTPGHFLVGGPLLLLPEPNTNSEPIDHLRRWKYVQALMKDFWNRWYKEYLPQLQVRGRWVTKKATLRIEDVVIIKEDSIPPSKWKLGIVTAVHPGKDEVVRVVTLRTSNRTEIKRPVVKLCRLPVLENTPVENDDFQRGEDVAAENGNN